MRRCPNGHEAPGGAEYCPTCGAPAGPPAVADGLPAASDEPPAATDGRRNRGRWAWGFVVCLLTAVVVAIAAIAGSAGERGDSDRTRPRPAQRSTTTTQPGLDLAGDCAEEVVYAVAFLVDSRGSGYAIDQIVLEYGSESIIVETTLALFPRIQLAQINQGTDAALAELNRLARPACEDAYAALE